MQLMSVTHVLGASLLLLFSLLSDVRGATITVPPLYQCEPAVLTVATQGNFTFEARDNATRKILFREKLDAGTTQITWSAVNLTADATAWFQVIDQVGTRRSQTTTDNVTAVVLNSPTGNTSCLKESDKDSSTTNKQSSKVPTIVGICLGVFFLLIILLVGLMVYRRKKERRQRIDNDSVDESHRGGYTQPGGGYMAKLVPGLNLQAARPLPRDIELEGEQAKYADERRMTRHYSRPNEAEVRTAKVPNLPTYGQSQRLSKMPTRQQPRNTSHYNVHNDESAYVPDVSFGGRHDTQADISDPFDSRYEQHPSLYNSSNQGWDRS